MYSTEIMTGKATKDSTMDQDGEGAPNYEQLQDLIQRECNK